MVNNDKPHFSRMLNSLSTLYDRRTLSSDDLAVWWYKLKQHELKDVSKAFDDWSSGKNMMPKPSDVLDMLRSRMIYKYPKLEKPKIDLVHAREKLKELKEKMGWKK